jgi:hypothetical protein
LTHPHVLSGLLLQIGAAVGLPFPQWFEAGKQTDLGNWSFGEQQLW